MSVKNKNSKPAAQVKEKPVKKESIDLKDAQVEILLGNFQEVALIEDEHKILQQRYAKAIKVRNDSISSIIAGAGYDLTKTKQISFDYENKKITFSCE